MKKVIAAIGLLALASTSHAVTTLGGDAECNGNGGSLGFIPFNGTYYLGCELPLSIAVDDTVVLAKESATFGIPIVWTLPGIVVVGNGNAQNANPGSVDRTELVVEAGAQVAGAVNSKSALLISRGARIDVQGTEQYPVVFSSLDDDYNGSQEWGGLIMAGFGQSSACPSSGGVDDCIMEGINDNYFYYGGGRYLNTTMSSGSLQYVVIAEGGHAPWAEDGIDGLNLYAVNDSTVIENIHVHNNHADGIQFFGGDVDVERLWLTCNEDDSVDWEEGYRGGITDLFIRQGGAGLGSVNGAEHAFELSSTKANGKVTNATIILEAGAPTPYHVFDLFYTMGTFTNIKIEGYTGVFCDAGSSGSFVPPLEYDCIPGNIPAETPPATGFDDDSFWTHPVLAQACD